MRPRALRPFLLLTATGLLIATAGIHLIDKSNTPVVSADETGDIAATTTSRITHAASTTTDPLPTLAPVQQEVLLDVPYISQQDYPTGCESISAVMLLQYWEIDITVDEFIDGYLECGETRWENGELIGPSPNDKFVGDPRKSSGYGCYAPVIEKAYQKLLDEHRVQNLTGGNLSEIATQYLDQGVPVLIWATIEMESAYPTDSWINEADGSTVQWLANEHCMVLVGYNNDVYYCNDPYNGNGVKAYSRALLKNRFAQMGRQALVIQPKK